MGILIRHSLLLLSFAVTLLPIFSASSQAEEHNRLQLQEQTIKAGLVYNFLKYTTWPEGAGGNLRVCFFGGEPLNGNLSSLEGRTAQQSTINIVRVGGIQET